MSFRKVLADFLNKVLRFFNSTLITLGWGTPKQPTTEYASERKITPITVGELTIGDIYLHMVVQIDFGLRIEEFTPTTLVRKKGDRFTPDLLVIDTLDPTSGKRDTRFVEELGLMPIERANLHRVFRATDEARDALRWLEVTQDTNAYIDLILPTLTEIEKGRLTVDGLFESIAEHGETASQTYDRHFDDLEDGENNKKKR